MDHENNSESKNSLSLDDRRIYRDPPAEPPPTPEEHAAYLVRLDEEFAPLIAAEEARKADEASKAEEKKAEKEV